MEIGFRKALESDVSFLRTLREDTMRLPYENTGIPWDDNFQMQRVLYRFECACIVTSGGQDVGLLKVDRTATPWMIIQIQVAREYQKKGIGERLLRSVCEEAEKAGVAINLEVLKGNRPAQRLYKRVGFHQIAEGMHFYLMQWSPGIYNCG